jgi:UDP-galactopyranose mutase
MEFDYLIVGAGPFGATFARRIAEAGRRALVIDRRAHLAGNCFTESVGGIHVHRYGPHIFHTGDERVWQFVRRFAQFNNYRHTCRVRHGGNTYMFPINLGTLRQLWGVETSAEAEARLARERVQIERPDSLRDWLLSQVGEQLYEMFFAGYTKKQWGRDPDDLPAGIVRRIPIRVTDDDHYFGDHIRYEGIPIGGYTRLYENMLDHPNIIVELESDYFADRDVWDALARRTVYSGKIDAFFNCQFGRLEYRSLRWEQERYAGQFQEVAMVNYAEASVRFTRTVEHKYFDPVETRHTIVTREFPEEHTPANEPYYPIRDRKNLALLDQYQRLAGQTRTIFGGRLGTFRYYNMDQVIAQALAIADREVGADGTHVRRTLETYEQQAPVKAAAGEP